jgi:hypothetical protein
VLTQSLRASVKNFIKETNLDTYENLSAIYDFVSDADPQDRIALQAFARYLRNRIDAASAGLLRRGERIIATLEEAHRAQPKAKAPMMRPHQRDELPFLRCRPVRYTGLDSLQELDFVPPESAFGRLDFFGLAAQPVPYSAFAARLSETAPSNAAS